MYGFMIFGALPLSVLFSVLSLNVTMDHSLCSIGACLCCVSSRYLCMLVLFFLSFVPRLVRTLVPCHGQFYNSFFDLLYQLAQVHPHNVLHFPNKLLVLGQFALNTLERLICNVSTNQPALNN